MKRTKNVLIWWMYVMESVGPDTVVVMGKMKLDVTSAHLEDGNVPQVQSA